MGSNKRKVPEINSGSMADIAFLLLCFFLVATTMDVDTGITRVLPPWEEKVENKDVKERNVLVILVNANDNIMIEGQPSDIRQIKEKTKEFFLNEQNRDDLPVKKVVEAPFIGNIETTPNAVVSIQNDRGTSYGTYIKVQNEVVAAIRELQQSLASRYFGKPLEELSEEQQDAVKLVHPLAVSEAEPKNIGGK